MRKTKVKMNKPIYLGFSILDLSKIVKYEFWYDYMKPKYADNVKLCYMDTDSFLMDIKTEDFYKNIADDLEKRFDTSNYECDRPLPKGKNKKMIGLMKDELGGNILTEFVALRPKTYSYLMDDNSESKKAKGTKKCVIKKILKFNDYKDCLLKNEIILKSQQRFKSETHRITSYPYETSAGKVCKSKYKMINFDDYTNENKTEHNSKWPYIPDHPYRILIIGVSGSGKTNALLNPINNQPDIDKIYLYAKDPYEAKYQHLINKHERLGLDHFNDSRAFMEYSSDMQDVYKNIEEYNPEKKNVKY